LHLLLSLLLYQQESHDQKKTLITTLSVKRSQTPNSISFPLRPQEQLEQIRLQLCGIFLAWQIHRGVHGFGKQKLLKTPLSIFLDLGLNNKKACFTVMWPAPDSKSRVIPVRNTELYDRDRTDLEASIALVFHSES